MAVVFRFDGGDTGLEPWVTDGTVSGTRLLFDTSIGGSLAGGGFDVARTVDDGVLFRASNGDYDGVWWTNGKPEDTIQLTDQDGSSFYRTGGIEFKGDYILVGSETPSHAAGVFRIDVSGNKEVLAGSDKATNARQIVDLDDNFVFFANVPPELAGTARQNIFVSDGTPDGTIMIPSPLDKLEGRNSWTQASISLVPDSTNGSQVFYTAISNDDVVRFPNNPTDDFVQGSSIWVTNGTIDGTERLDPIGSIAGGSLSDFAQIGSISYFSVKTNTLIESTSPIFPLKKSAYEMWATDGSSSGTRLISSLPDIYTGDPALPGNQTYVTGISEPIIVGQEIAFIAYAARKETIDFGWSTTPFAELHMTKSGTNELRPPLLLENIPVNGDFFAFEEKIIYSKVDGAQRQYFALDTNSGQETMFHETSSVFSIYPLAPFFEIDGNIVFVTFIHVGQNSILDIYSWDGTRNEAVLLGRTSGPSIGSSIENAVDTVIRQDGDLLYWANSGGITVSNGTLAGTQVIAEEGNGARILGVVPNIDPTDSLTNSSDFDGDGDSDIVWRNDDGTVHIWSIEDGLREGGQSIGSASGSWSIKGAGDFDGDGDADLLWRNENGSTYGWEMQDGTRVFGTSFGSAGPDWTINDTGDADGDGDTDIFWFNEDTNILHLWEIENGDRVSNFNVSDLSISDLWNVRGVGDFDKDGDVDVLWQNENGIAHRWEIEDGLRVSGTNIFNSPLSPDWIFKDIADFDGDGDDDILFQNTSGRVHIWEMENGFRVGGSDASEFRPNADVWTLVDTGDFDGDGDDDIIWKKNTGQVHLWEMEDGVRAAGINLSNLALPSEWSLVDIG